VQSTSGRRSQKERDTREESLVGGVVDRLELVSHGVGPSDLLILTLKSEMRLSLESRKV